jgi:hypothetical protein
MLKSSCFERFRLNCTIFRKSLAWVPCYKQSSSSWLSPVYICTAVESSLAVGWVSGRQAVDSVCAVRHLGGTLWPSVAIQWNCIPAIQETPNILWNPKVHCRFHKSHPLIPILIQSIPPHSIFPRSILILLPTHAFVFLVVSFLLAFLPILVCVSFFPPPPNSCYRSRPSHPPLLRNSNYSYTWSRVQITKLLVTQFSPSSRHSTPLPSKSPPQQPVLNTLSVHIPLKYTCNRNWDFVVILFCPFTTCLGPYRPVSGEIQHFYILKVPSISQRIRCSTVVHSCGVSLLLSI